MHRCFETRFHDDAAFGFTTLGDPLRRKRIAWFIGRAPRKRSAIESDIPNFVVYCLDTDEDGIVRKPDSLFMEATVPL